MFELKPMTLAVRAALLAPAILALPVPLQAASGEGARIEEVVVTGSRIQRTNLVTSSPVVQVDAEAITMSGVTRIEDLVGSLPQVYLDQGSGQSIEATGVATAELRSLGSGRTLILMDGKRLPVGTPLATGTESGSDLNFIPHALVKRVEVLTGGASSAYGSDAVAGVVNFIMLDDFQGIKLDVKTAGYRHDNDGNITATRAEARGFGAKRGTSTDGATQDATLIIGGNLNDGRGNVTAFATYRDIEPITQADRDYSACSLSAGLAGCGGSATSGAGTFFTDTGVFNVIGSNFEPDSAATRYNYAPPSYYQRPDERYSLGAFANYEITDQVKAYSQLMFMDNRTVAQFAPAGFFFDFGVDISCSNPMLSAQQATALGCTSPTQVIEDIYIGRRNVEGGPRFGDFRHTTYRGVFGLKGDINDTWRYDVSYQYAEVDMRNRHGNYFNTSRVPAALDAILVDGQIVCRSGGDCVPWNIFTEGGVTDAATDYLAQTYFEKGTTDQMVLSGYVQASLGDYGVQLPWASSGVELVFGLERREENLEYIPDDAAQAGDIGGLAAARVPVSGGYDVDEIFIETAVPLVSGLQWADDITLDLGYRYSDYSTGADAHSFKIATSWRVNEQVKLRGSFQRATRAGNVVELFEPINGTLFAMGQDPCAGVGANGLSAAGYTFEQCARTGVTLERWNAGGPASSPAAQYNYVVGGNTALSPEESDTRSFGFILTPSFVEGLTFSADWFDIEVQDAISRISGPTTLRFCLEDNLLCDRIFRGPSETLWLGNASPTNGIVAPMENIGFFRVKGIDVEASYQFEVGSWGLLNLATTLGYMDSWTQEEVSGAGIEECRAKYGGSCAMPLPKWRNRFTATWQTPWNVRAQATWRAMSGAQQIQSSTPIDIDAQHYFDLSAVWDVASYATVRAGVNNLLDKEPPIVQGGVTARENGNTYPNAYDHLGQYWFLGGSIQF